jgi:hypothetical protein
MKRKTKPLTEAELYRYERALRLWELALQKQEAELDEYARSTFKHVSFTFHAPESDAGNITPEVLAEAFERTLSKFNPDDDSSLTPEEFLTTIPPCGQKCYEGGEHKPDCARMIYLEVERIGGL